MNAEIFMCLFKCGNYDLRMMALQYDFKGLKEAESLPVIVY